MLLCIPLLLLALAPPERPAHAGLAGQSSEPKLAAPAAASEPPAASPGPRDSGGAASELATELAGELAGDSAGELAAKPDDDDDSAASEPGDDAEAESTQPGAATAPGILYTSDLSDAELSRKWKSELASLGTISVGFADRGRLINAVQLRDGQGWVCLRPDLAWGSQETVESLATVFSAVHAQFPESAPARLNHIGKREGGYLKPHRSHQAGRDADIGFFYKRDLIPAGRRTREKLIDPARNWALIRAVVTLTDVQVILVDRSIQRVLREYALALGEDRAFVDRVFSAGKAALVQHARRHRDHFHVRFYSPRSQELGRRVLPLLATRPDQNLIVHRVARGQTLGHIAAHYGSSVPLIMKANGMHRSFLHLDQRLLVPLRGACTHCPTPPPVTVPPRCLPTAPVQVAFVPVVTTLQLRADASP